MLMMVKCNYCMGKHNPETTATVGNSSWDCHPTRHNKISVFSCHPWCSPKTLCYLIASPITADLVNQLAAGHIRLRNNLCMAQHTQIWYTDMTKYVNIYCLEVANKGVTHEQHWREAGCTDQYRNTTDMQRAPPPLLHRSETQTLWWFRLFFGCCFTCLICGYASISVYLFLVVLSLSAAILCLFVDVLSPFCMSL